MDPPLFGVNSDVAFEVLGIIVLLSLFIERALSVVFEWRYVIHRLHQKGLKEPIAFVMAGHAGIRERLEPQVTLSL